MCFRLMKYRSLHWNTQNFETVKDDKLLGTLYITKQNFFLKIACSRDLALYLVFKKMHV